MFKLFFSHFCIFLFLFIFFNSVHFLLVFQLELVVYTHRRILRPISSPTFPLWLYPVGGFDLLLLTYLLANMVGLSLLLVWCAVVSSVLYIRHLGGTMNRYLVGIIRKAIFAYRVDSIVSRRLWFILVEHTGITIKLLTLNRELWSSVVYLTVLVHVPCNAYLQFRLWAHSVVFSGRQQIVTLIILANQLFFILSAFLLLSKSSAAFHRCARHLPALQCSVISKTEVLLKLKYMQLYERVNSDQKYGITMGPTSTITYLSTCQVKSFSVELVL